MQCPAVGAASREREPRVRRMRAFVTHTAMPLHAVPSLARSGFISAIEAVRRTLCAALSVLCTLALCLVAVLPTAVPAALAAPVAEAGRPLMRETALPAIARMPRSNPAAIPRKKTSFVTAAVEAVGPAVVRIDTERLVDRAPLDSYFFPGLEPDGQRKETGQGSGVILSDDGLIMTNAHVVKNAAKVTVTLTDGRTYEGIVKGSDDFIDLAAVRIKLPVGGKTLPTAPLGRSDELQVGDWVIAIGNAVGLDSTVTLGIVSSLSRSAAEVGIPNKKVNFIQTDAAINPGNSGGPLLNEFGEVIGVNTAIRANAAGIGFAIPIDTAEKAMRELSAGRKIAHAYLGISMSSLTPDAARQNNADPNSNVALPESFGALVLAVASDSPAGKAGIRKFDLITDIGGVPIKSANDAQAVVDSSRVGSQLPLRLVRQQRTLTLSVTTGDLSDRPSAAK
uniref:PDZ domain-containing protein n=1 Tax=Calcidiscus leptoporus TaxID=127549 RepID=A0A7S0IP79_9EUKA|mmetsp:Transcript_144/g.307  ORF Transcript_144/g.307 Transcript_144/m.307 type:complete len:451 (+) Transcript_144:3-1355(+)|eukprot:CAMPEP_0119361972 /NCGR_PEP_ID=MMETSP1334-20130426/9168_1 /TAXON_ID=127549 /ORGANISM="Calcidiscus leptoporus, Strain RCC1130" /LENGTH=450 /DNA_ID=CAMNT_0007377115 /DNA_START=1 /DNA_END=1353 /DNA_ORIENTATION=-